MINDTNKPLIFVGSNTNIHLYVDIAKRIGYTIAGMVDDDYHGQGSFYDIPIIARLEDLNDYNKYKDYQFICVTNWQPKWLTLNYTVRDANKRQQLINIMESAELDVATIVSPSTEVGSHNTHIGRGVFIDSFCQISNSVSIGDYTSIYSQTSIGNETTVGRNCVLQRRVGVIGNVTIEDDVYMAAYSIMAKHYGTLATGTVIHPGVQVMRDTEPHEVVGLQGKDLRRIYKGPTEDD